MDGVTNRSDPYAAGVDTNTRTDEDPKKAGGGGTATPHDTIGGSEGSSGSGGVTNASAPRLAQPVKSKGAVPTTTGADKSGHATIAPSYDTKYADAIYGVIDGLGDKVDAKTAAKMVFAFFHADKETLTAAQIYDAESYTAAETLDMEKSDRVLLSQKSDDLAGKIDKKTLDMMKELGVFDKIRAKLRELGPPPKDWNPEEQKKNFDDSVSQYFSGQFEKELQKQGADKNWSAQKIMQMRMLMYDPDAQIKGKSDLLADLAKVKTAALKDIYDAAGVPEGLRATPEKASTWNPLKETSSKQFQGSLNIEFQAKNEINLAKQIKDADPPLTADEQKLLRQVITDPSNSAPDRIKAMAKAVTAASTKEIQAEYGLPDTWVPPVGPTLWQGQPQVLNCIKSLQDMNVTIDKLIKDNPNLPPSLVNTMNAIKAAIQDLMNILYESQNKTADSTKKLSLAENETNLDRIKARGEQLQEQIDKQKQADDAQKKSGTLNNVMKAIAPIIVAVSIVAATIALGPAGTIIACYFGASLLSQTYGGPNLVAATVDGIVAGLQAITGNKISDRLMRIIVVSVISYIAITQGGMAGFFFATQLLATSGVVTDMILEDNPDLDKDEKGRQKAAFIGAITGACIGIVGTLLICGSSAGAFASVSEGVQTGVSIFKGVAAFVQLGVAGAGAYKGFVDQQYDNLQGDIAKIQAKIKTGDILTDDQIEEIKSMIKVLQDKLNDIIEQIRQCNESVSHNTDSYRVPVAV